MANTAAKRIQKELKEFMNSEEVEVAAGAMKLELVNESWTELQGQIAGPADTGYEGGRFLLDIKIPKRYPFDPPMIRFMTKIWHTNIFDGYICLDILRNQWSAAMTLRTALLSIQALLSTAAPNNPHDDVTKQHNKKQALFLLTARHWTNVYAGGPHVCPDCDQKVQRLVDKGIDEHRARVQLSNFDWKLDLATKTLTSSRK